MKKHSTVSVRDNEISLGHNKKPSEHNEKSPSPKKKSFGHNEESLGHNGESLVHNGKSFGHNGESLVHNGESLVHNEESFGHNEESFGHNGKSFGHNRESLVDNEESFGHNGESFGHNEKSFGHNVPDVYNGAVNLGLKAPNIFIMLSLSDGDIIPDSDIEFNIWQRNFLKKVMDNEVVFDIPHQEIEPLIVNQGVWDEKYALVLDLVTASPTNYVGKNTARGNHEKPIRKFIRKWIRGNKKITLQDLSEMQIPPIKTKYTKSRDVEGIPNIEAKQGKGTIIKFLYWVAVGEGNKRITAKPEFVSKVEFAWLLLDDIDTATHSVEECPEKNHLLTGKTPAGYEFHTDNSGKKGLLWARYIGINGSMGYWTAPVPFRVP